MCGIVGVYGHPEAANITYLGLHALQHRGQEAAGIVTSDGDKFHQVRARGLVGEAFTKDTLASLPGHLAIGHTRYSTAGDNSERNVQPFAVEYAHGSIAVAHNGNLVNAGELRRKLELDGSIFQSSSDTEVIVHLIARQRESDIESRIVSALRQVEGAYSLVFLSENKLIAVRDPRGFRPLCLGRLKDAFVFASESCAFDLVEAEMMRELEPGEMVVVDPKGLRSVRPFTEEGKRFCVFEHVYFARPDSVIDGRGPGQPGASGNHSVSASRPSPRSRPRGAARCPTRDPPPPSAMRARAAFPTRRASSARTTSAAPSSSRSSRFVTSACA